MGQTEFFSVRMPTKIKKRNNFSYLSVIKLFSVFVFLCPLKPLPLVRSQPASGEWNDSPCFSIIAHQFTGIVQWPAGLWAGQDGFEPGLTVCSGVRGTDTRKTSICHTFRQKKNEKYRNTIQLMSKWTPYTSPCDPVTWLFVKKGETIRFP